MGKHSLWPIFDAKRFFKSNGIFANIFFLFFCFHSNHCGHVLVTNALKQLDINLPLTDTVVNKCLCIFYTETKKLFFFCRYTEVGNKTLVERFCLFACSYRGDCNSLITLNWPIRVCKNHQSPVW